MQRGYALSFNTNSVLKDGNWVKIRVEQTGVCKISYEQLQSMGLNPAQVRVYGYGGAQLEKNLSTHFIDDLPSVPIYINKGDDGIFNKGDFILFYVQGPVSWTYNGKHFVHTMNTYSQYGYYFLSDNAGSQSLIENTMMPQISDGNATTVTTFYEHALHEKDIVNLVDVEGQNGGGKSFYGEKIINHSHLNIVLLSENIVPNTYIDVTCDVAAVSSSAVNAAIFVNGQNRNVNLPPLTRNGTFTEQATTATLSETFQCNNNQTQNITISVNSDFNNALLYLNYIEMTALCNLLFTHTYLNIRTTTNYQTNIPNKYVVSNVAQEVMVWDVTSLDSIRQVPTTHVSNTLTFTGSNLHAIREYVVVDPNGTSFVSYSFVGKVENQNLHSVQTPFEMLIITSRELENQAWRLANVHYAHNNMNVLVVTDEAIYNEFSSGTPDATAYRRIANMLYNRHAAQETTLAYLLLFGDGSFDNRAILPHSGSHQLLTYQADNSVDEVNAYTSDDFFGFIDDNNKTDIEDTMLIAVGRLPVNSNTEAEQVVNKIEQYLNNQHIGNWKNQLLFLADDGDAGQHAKASDEIAEKVRKNNLNLLVNKMYLDAFEQNVTATGEVYPMVKNKLNNFLSSGILFLNYSGHGSSSAITNEKSLTNNDIMAMTNANLGFWMFATCSFAHFDSKNPCGAELAVINPNGGAIAVLSSTRTVYATQNATLNNFLCEALFSHTQDFTYNMTIGQAAKIAKNKCVLLGSSSVAENKMAYVLLGDPAIHLNIPSLYNISLTTSKDTLKALDIDTLRGYITKTHLPNTANNNTLTIDTIRDFNGTAHITVFDKIGRFQTHDNDENDESKKQKLSYYDYTNYIFKGTTIVQNGKFELIYRLPKDIKYNFDTARIVAYAFDTATYTNNTREASGYNQNFIVGGSMPFDNSDMQGPDINIYLNTPSFQNGGTTFQSPRFYADIYDESGINMSGNGIGHDMLLTLDNDIHQSYVVNDYYTFAQGSYRQGQVNFLLFDLKEGKHTLSFRAWDLLNNSTTATLDFNVITNASPQIYKLTTYPNPVDKNGILHFYLEYDRQDYSCDITLYIFNLAGKMIFTEKTTNNNTLQWNLAQMNINPGIYLYKFMIKTENSKFTTKMGKIIVK